MKAICKDGFHNNCLTYTRNIGIIFFMIKSFGDSETEKIYYQTFSKKLPQSVQRIALRKMLMMDAAKCVEDLRVPPANHLELLRGELKGFYSIRVNDQYRIIFRLRKNDIYDVSIVDYH